MFTRQAFSKTCWFAVLPVLVMTINHAAAEEVIVVPAREHQQGNAQSVAFSPDGRLVAAGFGGPATRRFPLNANGGQVVVWEAATGKVVQHAGEYGDIVGLQFASSSQAWLYSRVYTPGDSIDANLSKLIRLGDKDATELDFVSAAHIAALSPTDDQLAIVKGRSIAQVFNGLTLDQAAREVQKLSIVDSYSARALAFSAEGKFLATVHGRQEPIVRADGTLVTSARSIRNKCLTLFETTTWTVQDSAISDELLDCTAIDVSREARCIATGHPDGIARVWDGQTLQKAYEFNLQTKTAVLPRFSPDGKTLALLTQPANSLVWRYANTPSGFEIGREQVGAACELVQYDTDGFQKLRTFRFEDGAFKTYHANRPRASLNPARMTFSPDSRQILVGCDGVVLLDAKTGEIVRQFDLARDMPKPVE